MKLTSYLFTLAAGVFITIFFFKSCGSTPVAPVIVSPKELIKKVEKAEKISTAKEDSLKDLLAIERKRVAGLNLKQNTAQSTIASLRKNIESMRDKPVDNNDYETGKAELYKKIDELNLANDARDSACDATVKSLEYSHKIKDSIIDLKNYLYAGLRQSFDTCIQNNIKLIDYSKQQKKELRKSKFGQLVWKVAAVGAGLFILKEKVIK